MMLRMLEVQPCPELEKVEIGYPQARLIKACRLRVLDLLDRVDWAGKGKSVQLEDMQSSGMKNLLVTRTAKSEVMQTWTLRRVSSLWCAAFIRFIRRSPPRRRKELHLRAQELAVEAHRLRVVNRRPRDKETYPNSLASRTVRYVKAICDTPTTCRIHENSALFTEGEKSRRLTTGRAVM